MKQGQLVSLKIKALNPKIFNSELRRDLNSIELSLLENNCKEAVRKIAKIDKAWVLNKITDSTTTVAKLFWDASSDLFDEEYYLAIASTKGRTDVSNAAFLKLQKKENIFEASLSGTVTCDIFLNKWKEVRIDKQAVVNQLRQLRIISSTISPAVCGAMIQYIDYDRELFEELAEFFSNHDSYYRICSYIIYCKMFEAGDGYSFFQKKDSYDMASISAICTAIGRGSKFDDDFLINILKKCAEHCGSLSEKLEPIILTIRDKPYAIIQLLDTGIDDSVFVKLVQNIDKNDTLNTVILQIFATNSPNTMGKTIRERVLAIFYRIHEINGRLTDETRLILYELCAMADTSSGTRNELML